jgi:hypothetical protein
MNRLKEFFEQPPEPGRENDFYEIESQYDLYAVSREAAAGRAFHRARRLEEKADRRPWEEDD